MTTETRSQDTKASIVPMIIGIALSALSGMMLLLAFPPYGIWPLAWIAFAPYLVAQYRLLPLRRSSWAPAIAMLLWLGPFMARMFGTENGPVFTLLGVIIAVICFFANKERKFIETTGYRWFILHGIINWVGFEMIRATVIPLVATSAFIGYTQATQPWLIQPVSIFSVYGLDLVMMLVNFVLAQGAMALFDRKWQPADVVPVDSRATRNWLIAAGATLVVWIGISLVILSGAPQDASTVRVAALQPGYTKPAFQDDTNTAEIRFETFAEDVREAAAQGAQIVYTPEMMFNFDPQVELTEELRALAKETDTYIYIDYTVAEEGEPWRNEAILLSPSGEFSEVYGKNKIPPGEPSTPTGGNFVVTETPLGRLAAMICHDANYTDIARKLTQNGAQIVSAGLNEFGGFGEQYWTNVTFRAVENRTAMVVIARETGSAIIDPYGRQTALDIEQGKHLVLVGNTMLGPDSAPYTSLGDILGWASLAGYIFFVVFQIRKERQIKKAEAS